MDKESAGAAQDVEVAAAQEDQAIEGLEQHAERHEATDAPGGEVPGVDHGAMAQATEADGAGGHDTASEQAMGAPSEIDPKKTATKHKKFVKQEKARAKATAARTKKRAVGKDWTADQLADELKKHGAQGVIIALNQRQAAQGVTVLKAANQWDPLIAALPHGTCGPGARKALDQMIADDVFAIDDAMKLFLVRYNHVAQDVGKSWTTEVMRTMWRQLAALPPADVTRSTAITTFDAIAGGGAFGPSWEYPAQVNTVQIGQDIGGNEERLEHTVRHEIGHGVHTEIPGVVNAWLQTDMQFWFLDDWDAWINELGGYPATFHNSAGQLVNVDGPWKAYLKSLVQSFTGSSSWSPAKATPDAGETADGQAAWAAMPAAVKNACAQSTTQWYDNYTNFQKAGDKRYFLNHWYHRPFTIGKTAFATIPSTNDTYTAMSEKEFFANCYAEYFENPEGVKDHSKWGGTLPSSVKSFFGTCIVGRQPYDKFKKKKQVKGTH